MRRKDNELPQSPARRSHWITPTICVGLVAIILGIYGQTHSYHFVNYDDNTYVYENPEILAGLSFHSLAWAFSHVYSSNWHPLTTISHMTDSQFFGLHAGAHHLINVFFHAANAVLLFLLLQRMTGTSWRSGFVAALFAVHPLHVESVAWIAERKDVLSGFFFLLTLAAYLHYIRARSTGRYLLVALLFAFGLMAKPMLVTVP